MAKRNLCVFILIATIVCQATLVPAEDASLEAAGPGGGGGGGGGAAGCGSKGTKLDDGTKQYVVGDDKGWGVQGYDYQAWADKIEFFRRDKLVFNYPKGQHSVIKVDENQCTKCCIPPEAEAPSCGHDVIELQYMGGIGFVSGKNQDCQNGVKFYIPNVKCGALRPRE